MSKLDYLEIRKLFEEVYGINLAIGINHLFRIIGENPGFDDLKPKLEKQLINIKKIQSLTKEVSSATHVFKLYTKAIIIQNNLMAIQRTILKSKASPLEWEDKTLSFLNDVYRKVKGIDEKLGQILVLFAKTNEKVPESTMQEYQKYICGKEYNNVRYDLINAIKAFNSGSFPKPTGVCEIPRFGEGLSWAEKMFTHRFRTVPLAQKEPVSRNKIEIDNTESPLVYNTTGDSNNTNIKKKIAVNQVTHYLNEAQRYANYKLTHKYNLSPKDRLDGYSLKLELEAQIEKETEASKKKNICGGNC